MPRVKTSNCVSCLFWFGSDAIGILPILIGMKEAKAVPIAIGIAVIRRGGPAAEAKPTNLKERMNLSCRLLVFFEKLFIDSRSLYFLFFLDKKKKQKKSSLRIKRLKF